MSVRKYVENLLNWLQTPDGKEALNAAIVVIDDLLGPDDVAAPVVPSAAPFTYNKPLQQAPKVRRANLPSTDGMKK